MLSHIVERSFFGQVIATSKRRRIADAGEALYRLNTLELHNLVRG